MDYFTMVIICTSNLKREGYKSHGEKNNVRERWSDVSHVFITVKSQLNEKRKRELLLKLHCMASERCFLVELKRKYADGPAIAIKLSKQIDKVVKSINKTLSEVNGLLPVDKQILYEEAKDPKSSLYSTMTDGGTTVPASLRRQIIDLSWLSKRCEEETNMLKEEMRRLVSFIHEQIRLIDEYVDTLQPDVPLNAGLTACLQKKRMVYSNQVCFLGRLWSGIWDTTVQVPPVKTYSNLSGIDHTLAEQNSVELNDLMLMREDEEDESFVLELSSDSDLSDDE